MAEKHQRAALRRQMRMCEEEVSVALKHEQWDESMKQLKECALIYSKQRNKLGSRDKKWIILVAILGKLAAAAGIVKEVRKAKASNLIK